MENEMERMFWLSWNLNLLHCRDTWKWKITENLTEISQENPFKHSTFDTEFLLKIKFLIICLSRLNWLLLKVINVEIYSTVGLVGSWHNFDGLLTCFACAVIFILTQHVEFMKFTNEELHTLNGDISFSLMRIAEI